MKNQRLFAATFCICLFVVCQPNFVQAQGVATSGGAPATSGGAPTVAGPNAATSQSSSSGTASGTSTSSGTIQTAVLARTSGPAGSATTDPSNSNPFVQTYGDYMSLGKPSNYATNFGPIAKPTVTFAKGIYTTTTTTATTTATTATQANGFTTTGIVRNPQYTTVLSDELPPVFHRPEAILSNVRAVIDRSSFLTSQKNILVNVNGNIIELRGEVSNEKERRMAEGMVRMTPGVYEVQNKLTISQSK